MKNIFKSILLICMILCAVMLYSCDEEGSTTVPGGSLGGANNGQTTLNGGTEGSSGGNTTSGESQEGTTTVHSHVWSDWKVNVESTCSLQGNAERSCSCGEKEVKDLEKLAHTEITDAAVAPTCEKKGLTEGKHCSSCLTVIIPQEAVAELGHSPVIDIAVPATCDKSGLTEGSHCVTCLTVLVVQTVTPATGHTPGDWTVGLPATISVNGLMYQLCKDCDVKVAEKVILATGSLGLEYKPVFQGVLICTVTGIGTCKDKDLYIGSLIEEHRVLHIGANAFEGCTFIESVTLPDGLENIAAFAFKDCVNLKNITFPGTKAEWIDFQKGFGWDDGIPSYTVHCTDGDITK